MRTSSRVALKGEVRRRTKEFGAWWDAQGFEMNSNTRAALVAMGQDMDRAREVLTTTERRAIEQVYRNEFRVGDPPKSPKEPKSSNPSAPKKPEDAIAKTLGVGQATVSRDMNSDPNGSEPAPKAMENIQASGAGDPNGTPPAPEVPPAAAAIALPVESRRPHFRA